MPIRPSQSASRAFAVLELLAQEPGAARTLSAIARDLGMNKATCQSVLLALAEHGYLVRSPELTYSLGPGLVSLGNAARSGLHVVTVAEPVAHSLSAELGLPCVVIVLSGEDIVVAVSANPRPSLGAGAALRSVTHRPPFGAALVAWSDEAIVDAWLGRADPPLSADARADYRHALKVIREQGFCLTIYQPDLAEAIHELDVDPGSVAAQRRRQRALAVLGHTEYLPIKLDPRRRYPIGQMSAPVFDHDGRAIASVLLAGFPTEMDLSSLRATGGRLNAAVRQLTTAIGGVWPPR